MKKKWFRMDNAALIFPAIMRRNWNNVFRVSVTMNEPVDMDVLNNALDDMRARFPSFFVCLHCGLFWYYLEECKKPVRAKKDFAYPLTHMSKRELQRCLIRVLVHNNRIAVEFYHSVTDGTGGALFLRNLIARYCFLKYGIECSTDNEIVSFHDAPKPEELQDGFQKSAGKYAYTPKEETVYRMSGTPEYDGFKHLITGILPTQKLLEIAHQYGVTVTVFLAAVMTQAVCKKQMHDIPLSMQKQVKITVPVNLRKIFHIQTFRNFALTLNLGIDPRTGDYSLQEICNQISHQLSCECVPQKMACRVAANVIPQKNVFLRVMPLPIKNIAMRLVYALRGESKGCLNLSNLGNIDLPSEIRPYVERFEFIIGVQYSYPNNCSVASYGGKTYINMIRSIQESDLERLFFSSLVELGIPVEIESNQ